MAKNKRREAFNAMMRAYDQMQRAEMMYGASFIRQWYYDVWSQRHAEVYGPPERPEFPVYVGWDGREHAEF